MEENDVVIYLIESIGQKFDYNVIKKNLEHIVKDNKITIQARYQNFYQVNFDKENICEQYLIRINSRNIIIEIRKKITEQKNDQGIPVFGYICEKKRHS